MTAHYQQDIQGALRVIGLKMEELESRLAEKTEEINTFVSELENGERPAFTCVHYNHDLVALKALVDNWQQRYTDMVFIGVGGSSLGAQMLVKFKGLFKKHKLNLHFVDNVDPTSIDDLIANLPLETTGVLSVSKSGGTIETLVQSSLFIKAFKKAGVTLRDNMFSIISEGDNPLRRLMDENQISVIHHPANVGGRFSVTTLVGLLPALVADVDVDAFRKGASDVLKSFQENPLEHAASHGAALSILGSEKGYNIQAMMPYSDKLRLLSNWYVQLWAESVGKDGKGTTPMPVVGSTDQHSSLQLFAEGPKDKIVSIILPDMLKDGEAVDTAEAKAADKAYLDGLTCGTLLYNQAHGTADAILAAGRPVRMMMTPKLSEKILGALVMHFMLETVVGGALLGVNVYDQPGVEDAKIRAMEYIQRNAH